MNAAPAGALPGDLLPLLDILIVNEHEVAIVAGALGLSGEPDGLARAIDAEHGISTIVTLGGDGAVGWTDGIRRRAPALKVDPVDTTAAGDSFCGAFAAALDQGLGFTTALARGAAAGSLACTVAGAQPSIPGREAIDAAVADFLA